MTTSLTRIPRMVLNPNGGTTAIKLVEDVALKSFYVANTFELVFQKAGGDVVCTNIIFPIVTWPGRFLF